MFIEDLNNYLKLKKKELLDLIIISIILGFLFSFTYFNINQNLRQSFKEIYFLFSLFIFIMLTLRLFFMKFVGYIEGFEINIKIYYLNRFGIRNWDTISFWTLESIKRIPVYFLSIFLYLISFGFFIFPCIWNYEIKQIPHRFIGKKRMVEYGFREISDYRYSKALFAGSFFFFIFAFFIKFITLKLSLNFFSPYVFILYWIAFFNTIPIPMTEGYELFSRNVIGWIAAITILIFSMFALTIFTNLFLIILILILSIIVITITLLWNMLMK